MYEVPQTRKDEQFRVSGSSHCRGQKGVSFLIIGHIYDVLVVLYKLEQMGYKSTKFVRVHGEN